MEDGYDNRIKTTTREHPKQESGTRTDDSKGKEPESAIDELIKGMRDLQLKFTKLEKGESSGVRQKPNEGERVNLSSDVYGTIARSTQKGIVRAIRKH